MSSCQVYNAIRLNVLLLHIDARTAQLSIRTIEVSISCGCVEERARCLAS